MHVLTADIAGGIRWLADLLPLFGAVLGVLVLFELAILLGSVIATLEERSARAERMEAAGPVNAPIASPRSRKSTAGMAGSGAPAWMNGGPYRAIPSPDALLEERPGRIRDD